VHGSSFAEEDVDRVGAPLATKRTLREVAELAVAAFMTGASERVYQSQLFLLERIAMDHEPALGRRCSLDFDWSQQRPGTAAGVVALREDRYRPLVVAWIWSTCGVWFQNAVREWINAVVSVADRLDIAAGLSALARTNFDDVESFFLTPWSLGRLGSSGKATAAHVLGYMCHEEATATLALQTAIRWTGSGDIDQRATAVTAFGGELGLNHPIDAAWRLWQLMTQSDDLCEASRTALGRLFTSLVDRTRQADAVLTMLDAQRARYCVPGGKHRMRDLALAAILAIVSAQSGRTGRPAVVELLRAEPGRREILARLWCSAIRHRPTRREALIALRHALPGMSGGVPEACALGPALAHVLRDDERVRLRADLAELDREPEYGVPRSPQPSLVWVP
jgi:hypothetical protein